MRGRLGRPWLGRAGGKDVALTLALCVPLWAFWWAYGGLVNAALGLLGVAMLAMVLHDYWVAR